MVYRGFELHYSRGTSLIEGIRDGRPYEPEITRSITPALRVPGGGLFLDIGANIGLITLNVLADVPAARVVAFEPGAHQAGLLAATVAANRLEDRVAVRRCALSDREGTAQFAVHRSRHASGDGFLDTHRAGRTRTVEVPVTTLDRWWADAGRPRVHAMKIDTEGAELWVLQGAAALLDACRPLVAFELNARNLSVYPHDARDVLRFFTQRGYAVRSVAGTAITEDNLARHLEGGNDYVAEFQSA
jgi:FkbM family methyltransferase